MKLKRETAKDYAKAFTENFNFSFREFIETREQIPRQKEKYKRARTEPSKKIIKRTISMLKSKYARMKRGLELYNKNLIMGDKKTTRKIKVEEAVMLTQKRKTTQKQTNRSKIPKIPTGMTLQKSLTKTGGQMHFKNGGGKKKSKALNTKKTKRKVKKKGSDNLMTFGIRIPDIRTLEDMVK